LKAKFFQSLSAYVELIRTGGIRCTAEGEKIHIEVTGNLAGDILVFISPKNTSAFNIADINELIQSDATLEQQRSIAFSCLRSKFKGLTLLPESIVWLLNIIIYLVLWFKSSGDILSVISGERDFTELWGMLPLSVITMGTLIYSKTIGLKIFKPVLWIAIRIVRFIRLIRNKNVA